MCAYERENVSPWNDLVDCSPPGSSVHWILQARMLEWVAISSSRGSFQPRDWTQVSRIASRFFTIWATREAHIYMVASDFPPLIWERLLRFMEGNASTVVALTGAGLCDFQHSNWLKGPPQMLVSGKFSGSCYSSAVVIKQILSEKSQSFGCLSSTRTRALWKVVKREPRWKRSAHFLRKIGMTWKHQLRSV